MDARKLSAAVALFAAAAAPAHADIYTWVDESGTLNVSNLEPPAGVTVTRVDRTLPRQPLPPPPARDEAIAALSDRVAALQEEIARRDAAPRVVHGTPPDDAPGVASPAYDGVASYAPAAIQQWISVYGTAPPPASSGCDPSWWGCAYGWASYGYPGVIVVPAAPHRGNARPPHRRPSHPGMPVASPRLPSAGLVPPPLVPASLRMAMAAAPPGPSAPSHTVRPVPRSQRLTSAPPSR